VTLEKEVETMLVLSRKQDESIVIGDNITVTVIEIRGSKIRLGIKAPKEIPVHRQEIYDAIHGKPAEPEVEEQVVEIELPVETA
jgi:carbon storage regulator